MSIWGLLSALIVVYLVLLSLRLLLSWFRGSVHGRPWQLLQRVTDPYLALFARLRFLRRGPFDFTPLAAILLLVVVLQLSNTMQATGHLSVGVVLGAVTAAAWSGVSFLLLFFLILTVLRLALVLTGRRPPLGEAVAATLEPVVSRIRKMLPRQAGEAQVLVISAVALFAVRWLGGFLVARLLPLLGNLPL